MTIELSAEEIGILKEWYLSASGEGVGAHVAEEFELLDKLGIEATDHDLYLRTESDYVLSHRPTIRAQNAARMAYRKRHADMESVQWVERQQPC